MKTNILFLLIIFLICSCDTKSELQKSVFISDPNEPDLPVYSEWGYNTFGAYYDRAAFTSTYNDAFPAKIIVKDSATSFVLDGTKQSSANGGDHVILTITLPAFLPTSYADAIQLNQVSVDLTQTNVVVAINEQDYAVQVLEGNFTFNRTQNLKVDGTQYEVILSGVFSFKAQIGNTVITVSDGRFDVGIGENNFFVL